MRCALRLPVVLLRLPVLRLRGIRLLRWIRLLPLIRLLRWIRLLRLRCDLRGLLRQWWHRARPCMGDRLADANAVEVRRLHLEVRPRVRIDRRLREVVPFLDQDRAERRGGELRCAVLVGLLDIAIRDHRRQVREIRKLAGARRFRRGRTERLRRQRERSRRRHLRPRGRRQIHLLDLRGQLRRRRLGALGRGRGVAHRCRRLADLGCGHISDQHRGRRLLLLDDLIEHRDLLERVVLDPRALRGHVVFVVLFAPGAELVDQSVEAADALPLGLDQIDRIERERGVLARRTEIDRLVAPPLFLGRPGAEAGVGRGRLATGDQLAHAGAVLVDLLRELGVEEARDLARTRGLAAVVEVAEQRVAERLRRGIAVVFVLRQRLHDQRIDRGIELDVELAR